MDIQIIYNKDPVWFQSIGDRSYSIIMFPPCFEISKAGEEVESMIKIVYPERQTHIMLVKLKIFILIFLCKENAVKRNINACYSKTFFCKNAAMPAPTAGNIQHITSWQRL
jgi:hypothetical protein